MAGRQVTIDEALDKIGNFSKQDAIDLIESSQNVAPFMGGGERGHPLQHCEMTTRAWPDSRFQNPETIVDRKPDGSGDVIRQPDMLALALRKGMHTMSWTDQHLIQALRDLFLGGGAFTALYHLKARGVGGKLEYRKPTSHTTIAGTASSHKIAGIRQPAPWQERPTRSYLGVFYHCPGGRLHLQTLFAHPDNTAVVMIKITKGLLPAPPVVMEFAL